MSVRVVAAVLLGLMTMACLSALSLGSAGPARAAEESPQKVTIGVYINDIQDITLASNSYTADIYVWLRWRNPAIDPSATLEVMNPYGGDGVTLEPLLDEPKDTPDGAKYMAFRGQGTFSTKMNLQRYPFDVQTLTLEFEDAGSDAGDIEFVPDATAVTIDPEIGIPGYVVKAPTMTIANHEYPTDFGESPEALTSSYSRVTVTVPVKREVLPLAIKIMMPIVIVILLTSLIYVLPARLEEARAGIAVTAMLTLMALQWTVTSNLPDVGYLMMIDVIYLVSMVYILIAMAYSVIGSRRSLHELESESTLRLDRRVGLASLAIYAALLVVMALLYLR